MLKKENRLTSNSAFKATYSNNVVVSNSQIVLYAGKIKEDKAAPTRVGFVVSKKISKRAVKRNRIKRLMRENIRLMFQKNTDILNKFQSLIFLAKADISDKSSGDVRNIIVILLEKLANKNI